MEPFKAFPPDETFTQVPESFFRQLLGEINDLDELKVTLHAIWRIEHMEGPVHVLREKDFAQVVKEPAPGLEKAIRRGSLLEVQKGRGRYYFLNTPRGRATAEALQTGSLNPDSLAESAPPPERPNVFRLYEENIGPLTPSSQTIADGQGRVKYQVELYAGQGRANYVVIGAVVLLILARVRRRH